MSRFRRLRFPARTKTDTLFYFNLASGKVEQGRLSDSYNRVGPFKTFEEAAQAPEILRARARKWAEEESSEEG